MKDRVLTLTELELTKILLSNFIADSWYALWCMVLLFIEFTLIRYGLLSVAGTGLLGLWVLSLWFMIFSGAACVNGLILVHIGEGDRVCEWCGGKVLQRFLMLHHNTRTLAKELLKRMKLEHSLV